MSRICIRLQMKQQNVIYHNHHLRYVYPSVYMRFGYPHEIIQKQWWNYGFSNTFISGHAIN